MLPHLTLYLALFPAQAEAETRTLLIRRHQELPDDDYAILESYCPDPSCDCRRVMLNVVSRRHMQRGFLASVSFGFDRGAEWAGPYLDPLNRQSRYANVLFGLVTQVLTDQDYVRRLEAHYRQVKWAAVDPADPAHQALLQLLTEDERRELRRAARSSQARRASWRTPGPGAPPRTPQPRTPPRPKPHR